MKASILVSLIFLVSACGAKAPFERGRVLLAKTTTPISKPTPSLPPSEPNNPVDNPANPPVDPPVNPPVIPPVDNPTTPPITAPIALEEAYFNTDVKPLLKRTCSGCHDNPAPTFKDAVDQVVPGKPNESSLYKTATGQGHRKIWAPDSPAALKLAAWINGQRI